MYDRTSFAFPELTPAVKRLLLVNVAVFLGNAVFTGSLIDWFGFSWTAMWEGYGLGMLRILSYQFVHDWQGIGHIFFNMLSLYFFGTMAERSLGYLGIYKLYLVGGAVGGLVHLLLSLAGGYESATLIGASGACYAFIVYAAFMAPRQMVILLIFPVPLGWLAFGLVFIGLYQTYVEFVSGSGGGVSHGAHLGGALMGGLAYKLMWFRDYTTYGHGEGLIARWRNVLRERGRRRQADRERQSQAEVDRILEKVAKSGLGSLTAAERRVLDRRSEKLRRR
jgi:membrane associated rhomboid family serine protease